MTENDTRDDAADDPDGVDIQGDAVMPEDRPLGSFTREEGATPGASGLPGEPGGATEAGLGGGEGDLGGGGDLAVTPAT